MLSFHIQVQAQGMSLIPTCQYGHGTLHCTIISLKPSKDGTLVRDYVYMACYNDAAKLRSRHNRECISRRLKFCTFMISMIKQKLRPSTTII